MSSCYTQEQLDLLRIGYKHLPVYLLTLLFNYRFGMEKSETTIKSTLSNHGFTCGRKGGHEVGERRAYSQRQIDFLKNNYPNMNSRRLTKAFNEEFNESKNVDQIKSTLFRYKIQSGRTGCFEKGFKPWNTGVKGSIKPNSGSFKKEHVPANTKPMYHERICSKDGFIIMKVPERNPYTGAFGRYKNKHVWIWEQAHGPVPEGHVVRFLDGDKMNCVLENLGLFTKAENLQITRLGFNNAPAEVKPTIIAMAKLDSKRSQLKHKGRGRIKMPEIEARVLDLGKKFQDVNKGPFSASDIQNAGWPKEKPNQASGLGISQALQNLKRKKSIKSIARGLYAMASEESER